jgi:carbamoyltransferase
MLRSVDVRRSHRDAIPAVVHADGTARVQTVPENGAPETATFAALIEAFRKKTGVPMLLNTSLNAGGSPIFSSRSQSLALFDGVPMDAICVGSDLFVK